VGGIVRFALNAKPAKNQHVPKMFLKRAQRAEPQPKNRLKPQMDADERRSERKRRNGKFPPWRNAGQSSLAM
jgi:hypothetical protein